VWRSGRTERRRSRAGHDQTACPFNQLNERTVVSYDSKKVGSEHYRGNEVYAFIDGKRVAVDAVTIPPRTVHEREDRHERARAEAKDDPEGSR
jgi:hypothetical protein